MLKWFKKGRRKSKAAAPPGFHTVLSDVTDTTTQKNGNLRSTTNYMRTGKQEQKSVNRAVDEPSSTKPVELFPDGEVSEKRPLPQVPSNESAILKGQAKRPLDRKIDLPPVHIKPIKEPKPFPPRMDAMAKTLQSQIDPHRGAEVAKTPSYLDTSSLVGSPPSIDTALFATETERGILYNSTNPVAVESQPPPIIETSKKKHRHSSENTTPEAHPGVHVPIYHSDMDVSHDLYRNNLVTYDYAGANKDFIISSISDSGTGSKKLEAWLNEVQRIIKAQRCNPETCEENHIVSKHDNKIKKAEAMKLIADQMDVHESFVAPSKAAIEKSLAESAARIREKKLLKYQSQKKETSHSANVFERTRGMTHKKFFSKSQRQRHEHPNEDEEKDCETTTSCNSTTTSGMVHTTERSQASSDDASQDSEGSFQGFIYNRIREFGDQLGYGEDDLCRMEDNASITDETATSRSTMSGNSFIEKSCGMCGIVDSL